jgi:DNA-binding CsgD family transcriptional regulator
MSLEMSSPEHSGLSRKEWFVALVAAHGGSSNQAASSLGVQPGTAEQLLETARRKLGARSGSEIRRVIQA